MKTADLEHTRIWYVVRTKPNMETLARLHLERQNYTVYLPMYSMRKKRAGKWGKEQCPWFPGYLFLGICEEQNLSPVRSTRGVLTLVRFGDVFATIDKSTIGNLLMLEQEQDKYVNESSTQMFAPGKHVLIDRGPLAGNPAVVSSSGKERINVLLELMGRSVRVNVSASDISPRG